MRISDWSSDVCSSDLWAWATAGFALLWLVTLVWALQRRPQAAPQRDGRAEPSKAGAGLRDLKRVLDSGDFGQVANVLCAMADPPAADLDALRERLPEVGRSSCRARVCQYV